ncbi:MAG: MFS transporter [Holosporaceae bacterium]|jgi:MHS family proline/betaine transporter-like MFS transporter|nr:MFS transporter [Holosporaceae bacterium]
MSKTNLGKYESVTSALGNVMEWYSFALLMPFLPVISEQFFPLKNVACSKLLTFFVVSIGLFMRPLGAVVFGPIGDKFGRRRAISLSVLLMAVPTVCIGILPDYHHIGIAAPILLVLLRSLQGIALGGEYTTAMVHLVELAPTNHRGFYGSWSDGGSQVGVLIGGQALVLLYSFFSEPEIYSFAWRVPFLLAVLLVPFAFLVPEIDQKKTKPRESIFKMLLANSKEVVCTVAITAFSAVGFYTLFTFLPYHLVSSNMFSLKEATWFTVASNAVMIVIIFGAGYLSDKYRRKPFLISGVVGVLLVSLVMFMFPRASFIYWLILQSLYGFFIGFYYSCRAAFFAEAFPVQVRCTAVSVSLSVAQAIFGGLTPAVVSYCQAYSDILAVVPIALVSLMAIYAILQLEDRTGKELL